LLEIRKNGVFGALAAWRFAGFGATDMTGLLGGGILDKIDKNVALTKGVVG